MLGLFFGQTDFPEKILKKIKQTKKPYFIIDLSKDKKFKNDKNSHQLSIGQFGKIIDLIKKKNCKKVLFAGKINKPNFSTLKLDLKGLYYFPKILRASKLGDASILKEIIKILAKENVRVISSIKFNPELTLTKGCYTKIKPNRDEYISINNGIKFLQSINSYNHVQALVIRNSRVIATETSKGTKKMLQQIQRSKKFLGILIKYPKKKQDIRIDLPTKGLDTLKDCKKAGIKGIILKSKQNIFMDKRKSISFANKNKIFVKVY